MHKRRVITVVSLERVTENWHRTPSFPWQPGLPRQSPCARVLLIYDVTRALTVNLRDQSVKEISYREALKLQIDVFDIS